MWHKVLHTRCQVNAPNLDDGGGHGCLQKLLHVGRQGRTAADDETNAAAKGPLDCLEQKGLEECGSLQGWKVMYRCTNI